ncbi:MAG TPA: outer membrane beta-barrel protein, partial [Dongiaceae bacterium]|nr:outer membrane beta-barrel protein [Dongiaceae bacterium]
MKKALIGTALASGLLLATPSSFADTGYIGIDYQLFTTVVEQEDDLQPEAVALRLGGNLNDYFQVEGRIGSGTKGDDNSQGESLQVDNIFGFYLKGGVDIANLFFPYMLVGYTKV